MSDSQTTSQPLSEELRRIRGQWRRVQITTNVLRVLAVLGAWVILWHAADLLLPLGIAVRSALLPINAALLIAVIVYPIIPLLRPFPLPRVAALIESRFPELRQEILTAWQWEAGGSQGGRERYSPEIIAALQQRAVQQLREERTARAFTVDARLARGAAAAAALWLASVLVAPSQFVLTLQRMARPAAACGGWRSLRISPGSARIASGQGIVIAAALRDFHVQWRRADGGRGTIRSSDGRAGLEGISQPMTYRLIAGRIQSPAFPIAVYQPLALSRVTVRVVPPAYARLPRIVGENQGDFSGLMGSRVLITAVATQRLAQAGLALDSMGTIPGAVAADSLVSIAFTLRRSGGYRLWAQARSGDTLLNAIRFTMTVVPDAVPVVELLAPEADAAPDNDIAVTVRGHAADDFGLTGLRLAYQDRGGPRSIAIASLSGSVTDTVVDHRWYLGGLGLLPGDSLVYWLEAADNDAISGPKIGRSGKQVIRLPSIEDVFRLQQLADSAALRPLEQSEPQHGALQQELERLEQAIKESRQLEWQQKAAVEQAMQQQQQLLQHMEQSSQQALDAMRADQARFSFDQETMTKLAELRQLFDQTATDEMRRAMEKMRQAIEQANRDDVQRALEQLKFSQQDLKQRLDAAIAGLKQLQQQQQLGLLQRQAEELLREQQDVRQQAADASSDEQRQQLARRQEQLAKDTDFLGDQLRQQASELEQNDRAAAQALSSAARQLQSDQTAGTMRQAGQQIRSSQRDQAAASQQRAIGDLAKLAAGIKQASASMRSQRSKEAAKALRQKAGQVISLSQQQEDLNRRLERAGESREDLADDQQSLARAAARLQRELAQMQERSLPMPSQAGKAMNQAMARMKMAGQSAIGGQGRQAGDQGQAAQAALNEAAMALMQSAGQNGGSSGSGDMMDDLEGMSSRQQALNQQTGPMKQRPDTPRAFGTFAAGFEAARFEEGVVELRFHIGQATGASPKGKARATRANYRQKG